MIKNQLVSGLYKRLHAYWNNKGYHATGLKQIVKESAAPMGSLYHYFPNGKEELAVEAISCTQMAVTERIKAALAGSTRFVEGLQTFMLTLADQLDADPTCYGWFNFNHCYGKPQCR